MKFTGSPLSFEVKLDRVAQHIVRARLFLDLWLYFEEDCSRREIIDTMREYGEFFRFSPHAYLMTYIVYMAGVFESRTGTISLVALVRDLKVADKLQGPDTTAIEALIEASKPVAKKVAILRNNAFAHRTASMSYNDVFEVAAVTPGDFRKLTDTALSIANMMLRSINLQEQHFTDLPREDAASIMKTLSKAHG